MDALWTFLKLISKLTYLQHVVFIDCLFQVLVPYLLLSCIMYDLFLLYLLDHVNIYLCSCYLSALCNDPWVLERLDKNKT